MATLTKAHNELFRRTPDECFPTFEALYQKCAEDHIASDDLWSRPQEIVLTHDMTLCVDDSSEFRLTDWSFSQLCRMAGVSRDTINRLSPKTASKAFEETLPHSDKPLQLLTTGDHIRSVHGVAYTRLWNIELLDLVKEFTSDFTPPQTAMDGQSTGLYCGEQDMFAFLIDPTGWAEIEGEAFAPGFFLWNSEVGRRTLGIQTFWFQRVCQNHIVWDAVEVAEFTRKHTANVREGLNDIRRIIENLVAKRDARRDGFVECMRKAMTERLGNDADEVIKLLTQHGIPRGLVKEAMETAREQGGFTIFSVVDALTRLSQSVQLAGDRAELDMKIGSLLGAGGVTMDPQATWDVLLQAWSKRNWNEVAELSESLLDWLAKGGFPPETNYPKELGADWDSAVALAACGFAWCRSRNVLENEHGIPADVPFSLACAKCLDEGPKSFDDAKQTGWSHIEYYPAGKTERFIGVCPDCSSRAREL